MSAFAFAFKRPSNTAFPCFPCPSRRFARATRPAALASTARGLQRSVPCSAGQSRQCLAPSKAT